MGHLYPSNSGGLAIATAPMISIIHHCQVCPRPIPLLCCDCRECGFNSGVCTNCGNYQFCKFCKFFEETVDQSPESTETFQLPSMI